MIFTKHKTEWEIEKYSQKFKLELVDGSTKTININPKLKFNYFAKTYEKSPYYQFNSEAILENRIQGSVAHNNINYRHVLRFKKYGKEKVQKVKAIRTENKLFGIWTWDYEWELVDEKK